ncbi:unnamed protein product, partial [Mesorhabditis belari]|uniref:Uncharacterized protein n=1 Tax=Mesorhabditis belari TaxID=2138241 RepID=A0AAF3FM98_9BILA
MVFRSRVDEYTREHKDETEEI